MNYELGDEDPGACVYCGRAFELVRPGKSQETCDCYDMANITNGELRELKRLLKRRAEDR